MQNDADGGGAVGIEETTGGGKHLMFYVDAECKAILTAMRLSLSLNIAYCI